MRKRQSKDGGARKPRGGKTPAAVPAYVLKRFRRSRHVRILVHADASVVVTAPPRIPASVIERFVAEQAAWVTQRQRQVRAFAQTPLGTTDPAAYRAHKEKARKLAAWRLAVFNERYGFRYGRISIRNQKSRWGSCTHAGNLSFNYKIALLPQRLADYVIVHELCHVRELNHGPRFWALVARTIPDYEERRDALARLAAGEQAA
ncbi:MAG TPA: M48 family metallopeptidase [Candidatus Paceibacterota bacterium]|nr:M48 family metallopeptidase [Candidatus Paceibacterota bacterium]